MHAAATEAVQLRGSGSERHDQHHAIGHAVLVKNAPDNEAGPRRLGDPCRGGKSVRFNSLPESAVDVTPYSQVYGLHPRFFNCNTAGETELTEAVLSLAGLRLQAAIAIQAAWRRSQAWIRVEVLRSPASRVRLRSSAGTSNGMISDTPRSSVLTPGGQKCPGGQGLSGNARPLNEQTMPAGHGNGWTRPSAGQ